MTAPAHRVKDARNREKAGKAPAGADQKVDNNPLMREAKLDLRRRVLAEVSPAHVLDAFCGRGEMYRAVWKGAAAYAGCDERPWEPTDPPRYVADNLRLLRALDLSPFNVFDLDAYGSPWEQAELVLHRRRWGKGEVGALILTDGSARFLRLGNVPHALARLTGVRGGEAMLDAAYDLQRLALSAWLKQARVKVRKTWQARTPVHPKFVPMVYTAVVFEGLGEG
jgi:hypothetical protein